MFNHYFFGGEAAHETCRKFLRQDEDERVIMVADPPFGGLVEALASSFKKLMAMWKDTEKGGNKNQEMPMFWIFPYFFESRILEFFPSFSMMDYQQMLSHNTWSFVFSRFCALCQRYVSAGNHHCEICNSCTSKAPELYNRKGKYFNVERVGQQMLSHNTWSFVFSRFCALCQRYVSAGNHHCEICNSCTSKDGRRWKHCALCQRCVKP
ncbi:UNVERIFIED_CONTAM: hypothetical protein H355_003356 [Colinus virginianus]|nr:hypothetical protein H355_003356 [Colinus virginianus]